MPKFIEVREQGRPRPRRQLSTGESTVISLHGTKHQKDGADEFNLDGLSGVPVDVEEDIAIGKNLFKGIMNAICEDEFSWDDFDWEDVDVEDIEELVEDGLDRFLEKEGGTMTGQLLLSGKGITYDDLRTPINSLKLSGTKPPTWTTYKSGEVLAFSDQAIEGNEEHVFFQLQMPHTYKEGTDISIHVHFTPEDNAGGDVYWMLTYSWANIDVAFPTATTVYIAAACGTTTDAHRVAYFADIDGNPDGVNKLISSMLICKLQRRSSDALDTYDGKSAYLLEVDVHYQIDSLGSPTALVK